MSAQSVTRIAGSGTTVYQCCKWSQSVQDCASFVSSSRNSDKTATRSSPLARRPSIVDTCKNKKHKFGQKARLNVRAFKKKTDICNFKNVPQGIFPLRFYNSKKLVTALTYEFYGLNSFEKNCTTHFCKYFGQDGISPSSFTDRYSSC